MTSVPSSRAISRQLSDQPSVLPPGSHIVMLVVAGMLALMPAAGMPNELVLQDTLKSSILAAGTLGAAWVWWWAQRGQAQVVVRWHGILLLPLALLVYALGSMLWSHTYLAGVEAARWAVLSLLLWLVLQAAHPTTWMRLVWGVHWGALGASAWAAAQFWGNLDWFAQAAAPASTFVNRNFFAEYAVCALPFSVFALAQLRSPRWRQLMALSVAFNTVALMMTGTRSALTALLLITPVLTYTLWRYRGQLALGQWSRASVGSVLLVAVLGVTVLGGIRPANTDNLTSNALARSWDRTASMTQAQEYTHGSFSLRAAMWKSTARMVMGEPWRGVGAGAWEIYIPFYQGPAANEEPDYYAHNEYLQLLAEYGLPAGGGVLAVLLAYLLLAARNTWRLPRNTPEAPLRAIALASLLALLVVSLAGFPWRLASTGALMALSLALLATTDVRLQLGDALGSGRVYGTARTHWGMGVTLLLGSVLALVITVQAMRTEIYIVRSIYALGQAKRHAPSDAATSERLRLQGMDWLQAGLAINPHYRKLLSIPAQQLAALGDWHNTAMVLRRMATSRPHIANVWANLVLAHAQLGQAGPGMDAWKELVRLQPDAPRTRALELLLLSRTDQETQAIQKLKAFFDQGVVEYDMTQLAYGLGLRLRLWDLAERGLLLRAQTWPDTAADSYFRLGNVYVEAGKGFEGQALAAFRQGWLAVPAEQKSNYKAQVPALYRAQL